MAKTSAYGGSHRNLDHLPRDGSSSCGEANSANPLNEECSKDLQENEPHKEEDGSK